MGKRRWHKRKNIRRKVVMVTRTQGGCVSMPWEMFSTMEKYNEWLSGQDDKSEFSAEWMDGYEAASYVEDNMLWGYKMAIQSCTCEEEVDDALNKLYASDSYKQHERWLEWLGA